MTLTDEQRQSYLDRAADCLTRPVKQGEDDQYFLLWMSKTNGEIMMFHPETEEDLEDARLFYNACYRIEEFARPISTKKRPKRSAEEQALIRGIIENRDDVNRYLVYSDYLTERGDTQGEFIRVCIEIDRTPEDSPDFVKLNHRWREMLEVHGREWYGPLEDMGLVPEIFGEFDPTYWLSTNGVIDSVSIDQPGVLPEKAKQLFEAAPLLRTLEFEDLLPEPKKLAKIKQLEQIEGLELSNLEFTPQMLGDLLKSKFLGNLKELTLSYNELYFEGFSQISSTVLTQLTHLDVTGCELDGESTAEFLRIDQSQIKSLCLGKNNLDVESLFDVASSQSLAQLQHLRLNEMSFEWGQTNPFEGCTFRDTLQTLDISQAVLGEWEFTCLVNSIASDLKSLNLSSIENLRDLIAILSRSKMAKKLDSLFIDHTSLTDAGLSALVSGKFSQLTTLELSRNRIRQAGIEALVAANPFPKLEKLNLWGNQINAAATELLAGWKGLSNLRELELHDNSIGFEGATALAGSKYLKKLRLLRVSSKSIKKKGVALLTERFGDDVLDIQD
jgi:uncharacterized protein (TIGR02996 family)